MTALDVRTVFLIFGLLYLLMPIVTWLLLAGQRSPQVMLWCGGGLLIGYAGILTGFRDSLPEWVYISVAAMLARVSTLLRIQSLRLDMGIPWRWRWIILAEASMLTIFQTLYLGMQNNVLRAQFNSFVLAVLLLYLALLALRIGTNEQSPSAKWIARVYGLVAVAMLYRVLNLIRLGDNPNLLNEGLGGQLLGLSLVLSSVVGHFGYVGLALDRSMRRELKAASQRARDDEARRLGQQIAQLDRQRSLGELSASLGHELNQPLTAILTNAQVAQRGLHSGQFAGVQLNEFFDKIIHNTRRATQIIERIRGFIRPSAVVAEPVDLNLIVSEVIELVADETRARKVNLMFRAHPECLRVMGDPIQLSQIIVNVFRNAIEAMSLVTRRELRVVCSRRNGQIVLRICDSGPGFTAEVLEQLGMPFFTTKSNGLGMGISISRSIALQHGGTLTFANAGIEEGGGAAAELELPALSEA